MSAEDLQFQTMKWMILSHKAADEAACDDDVVISKAFATTTIVGNLWQSDTRAVDVMIET